MDKELLRYYISKNNFTISSFCKSLGIGRTAFYNKTHRITEFTCAEICKMISLLNLTRDEVSKIFFNEKVS